MVGGAALRHGDDIKAFLESLVGAGIKRTGFSFYGAGPSHDEFAGRRGDYEFLLELARAQSGYGLARYDTLFLRRSVIIDLPVLVTTLRQTGGTQTQNVVPFDYRGRGKLLEDERPTSDELEGLPLDVSGLIDRHTYKSEEEWLRAIISGGTKRKTRRHYLIPIWEDNADGLLERDPGSILRSILKTDRSFRSSIPPLKELAAIYGQKGGQQIYSLRDLEWKWTDSYLEDHSETDRSGVFDDLSECVIYK